MINILYLHAGAEMYGSDKVLLDLIKNLDKTKYKPFVVLPCDGVLVEALKRENVWVKVINYPIMRRKYFNPKGVFAYFYNFFKYSKVLLNIARDKKIDIVHTNTSAVLEGSYISRKLKVPQVWSVHEILLKPKIIFKVTRFLIAKYSSVAVAVSEAVKENLLSSGYFKDNAKVIYNGVDSDYFNPQNDCTYLYDEFNIPRGSKVIGMIGRVNAIKGQNDFLKAANIIMSKHKDVYTVFVGDAFEGEEWRVENLKNNISKSPYKDRIIMQGYRTDNQFIHNLFDIYVMPSVQPDSLPTVVLEAMATGKPVVGYRHGGICEMVKDGYNGFLAEVGNPEDLAAKIECLLCNDELRKVMGERARKRQIEMFSLDSYISNFSKLYDSLSLS